MEFRKGSPNFCPHLTQLLTGSRLYQGRFYGDYPLLGWVSPPKLTPLLIDLLRLLLDITFGV